MTEGLHFVIQDC